MRHEKQVGIRARDVDATGHVARASVALYFEEARDEWLEVVRGSRGDAPTWCGASICTRPTSRPTAKSVLVMIELDGLGTTIFRSARP